MVSATTDYFKQQERFIMSYTLQMNSKAPQFNLKATDGKHYSLSDFSKAKGLVVFFTCNHCPYVIGSNENTKKLAEKFQDKGIEFVAINSNSSNTYKEDSYENMVELMNNKHFPWTYLHDEAQEVARAYGALKTPHFFFFNEKRELIYTGRSIDNPRDHAKATTHELQDAIEAFLKGIEVEKKITNPVGCNVKWDGKPPHWMPPEACDLV